MNAADPALMPAALAELVGSGQSRLLPGPLPAPSPRPGQSEAQWRREVALSRARHDACALRAAGEAPAQPAPPTVATRWASVPVTGGEVNALVYTPEGVGPFGAVVLIHGGAFWMGGGAPGFAMNDTLCRVMCARAGVVVVNVDHRLAPEHPYPTPLEDVYDTLVWLQESATRLGVDPDRVAVHGISSGGNLAAAVVQLSLDRGGPPVRAQVLQSPSLDLSSGSRRFVGDPEDEGARQIIALYRGAGPGDPESAPSSPGLRADLAGLPPALVVLARFDNLAADARAYAQRLQAAGVPTTVLEYPMTHTVAEPQVYRRNQDEVVAWVRASVADPIPAPGDDVLGARLERLDLAAKVRLLTGADFWRLPAEPLIGLRSVVMSDGPVGVRGRVYDERDPSLALPCPAALGASWDTALAEEVGLLLAGECRRKGVDVLLAPTLNLQRDPRGGRCFENLSEDPLVVGQLGAALVGGVQRGGVAATPKHFVANDSETERYTVDVRVDEVALREVYLAPFETAVRDAGALAVMAAYNAVDGVTMTENPLLRDVLKDEWGFAGPVVSDWMAGRSLAAAAPGLLDVVMPGPSDVWADALVSAVRAGHVPERAIDDKVRRVLRLAAAVGALEGVAPRPRPGVVPEPAVVLHRAAVAGTVLLRNDPPRGADAPALPWRTPPASVAVIGEPATRPRVLGGGSAVVCPAQVVAPLDGLRRALSATTRIEVARGVRTSGVAAPVPVEQLTAPDGAPGLLVEYLGSGGRVLHAERREAAVLDWLGHVAPGVSLADVRSVRIVSTLRAAESGAHTVALTGAGRTRLTVGDQAVDEVPAEQVRSAAPGVEFVPPPQVGVTVHLHAGQEVPLVVEHVVVPYPGRTGPSLGAAVTLTLAVAWDEGAGLRDAARAAAACEVAVLVVGTGPEVESEGFDRTTLRLPGRQDELIRAVVEANPRTVVVVNAGAPVLLDAAADAPALLVVWFPGQEGGTALADILLGRAEPGGRLPLSWPATDQPVTSLRPEGGVLRYDDGLLVGHRDPQVARRALFPFGHGLGYATWRAPSVDGPRRVRLGEDVVLRVRSAHDGDLPSRAVVAARASWLRRDDAPTRPGPERWLAGFATADADPGRECEVELRVPARTLREWFPAEGTWTTPRGLLALDVGAPADPHPVRWVVEVGGEQE